jgi:chromosome segregation ATPase
MSDNLVLEQLRIIRSENADMRGLLLGLVDQGQRFDRRLSELDGRLSELRREVHEVKDDIGLMLKAEIAGRIGNFETRIEATVARLEERVAALEIEP